MSWLLGKKDYGVSERLCNEVEKGTIWTLVHTGDSNCLTVNCADKSVIMTAHPSRFIFDIELDNAVNKALSAIMLFPVVDNEIYPRVLRTWDYRDHGSLGKIINMRLSRDTTLPVQFALCRDDYVFRFSGITGNIYIRWATQISMWEVNDPEIMATGSVPILINTDGHFGLKWVYPLVCGENHARFTKFILRDAISWRLKTEGTVLFSADQRLEAEPPRVTPLTESEAKVLRERRMVPEGELRTYDQELDGASSGVELDEGLLEFFTESNESREAENTVRKNAYGAMQKHNERKEMDSTDCSEEAVSIDSPKRGVENTEKRGLFRRSNHRRGNTPRVGLKRANGRPSPRTPVSVGSDVEAEEASSDIGSGDPTPRRLTNEAPPRPPSVSLLNLDPAPEHRT